MTSSERSPAQGNNETVARHHGARDNDNRHVLWPTRSFNEAVAEHHGGPFHPPRCDRQVALSFNEAVAFAADQCRHLPSPRHDFRSFNETAVF